MRPSQVSAELRRVAAGIDRCRKSVRRDLVARDLGRVLSALDPDYDDWPSEAEEEFEDDDWPFELGDLTLQDVMGGPDYDYGPEERALMGLDPKFRKFLHEKLGPGKLEYEDVKKVLMDEGLDEVTASQYALFAMHGT